MTTPFEKTAVMMGMPSGRKTRRGTRKKASVGTPGTHLANLTSAITAGDHGQARRHVFALLRSLPQPAVGSAGTGSPSLVPSTDATGASAPAVSVNKATGNPARLVAALRAARQAPTPSGMV